ncbi:porin [Burkholderia pseudomultivorans]|uniref:Porin n=1 Tax=Burkholderia pseudomultivorans TaxID=1207504 RepID=A0A132F024_9BURK|nr:porin [Burkholderia pseudomultivorans]KWF63705.1 porin [Burkholderia pseudomultivorans]
MNRTCIAGLFATALCGSAFAQSSVTLYGSLDSGVAYVNNSGGHALFKANQSNMQPDRWGITGAEDLGGGLRSVFRLENGFFTNTGAFVNPGAEFNRRVYVGLESDRFGTLTLGHQSALSFDLLTPFANAYAGNSWNMFHPGNVDGLANSATSVINNAVKYRSPSYGGVGVAALFGFGNTTNFGRNDTWSAALTYDRGPFHAAAFYQLQHDQAFALAPLALGTFQGQPAAGYVADRAEFWGAGGAYTLGPVKLHALYTRVKLESKQHADIYRAYDAGAEWSVTPFTTLTAGANTTTLAAHRWTQAGVGCIYALSKQTQLYLQGVFEHTNPGGLASLSVAGLSSTSNQVMVLSGIHHNF